MKIKIKVTQDHINRGVKRSVDRDPISLALKEHPKLYGVKVGFCDLYNDNLEVVAHLPKEVGKFIDDFDAKGAKAVTPFEFEVTI